MRETDPRSSSGSQTQDARTRAGTVTVTPCDSKGTWLITLHGEHDLATRLLLEEQTRAIWPLCTVAVLDLSEATFIDSGVIRWLVSVERELAGSGCIHAAHRRRAIGNGHRSPLRPVAHALRGRLLRDARRRARADAAAEETVG